MLHMKIADSEKLDRGNIATVVLGTLVAGMSVAILVLLYMPLR